MTRKDFILIAEIILKMDGVSPEMREHIATEFARGLRCTNGQFKSELFIQAATGQCPLTARRAR